MFKISIYKDPFPYPECESKGHLTIHIKTGYTCGDRSICPHSSECKYKANHRFHNFSVCIHRFFEYNFKIKLPHLIYIGKHWKRLSGTSKCPYKMERIYTCLDCSHQTGLRECDIAISDRKRDDNAFHNRCGSFEKCEWADDYKDDIDEERPKRVVGYLGHHKYRE